MKLPNIGFDYDIFSNFDCDYAKQAVLITDSEDDNCANSVVLYTPATTTSAATDDPVYDRWVDSDYKIVKNTGSHVHYAIQKSSVYRNR